MYKLDKTLLGLRKDLEKIAGDLDNVVKVACLNKIRHLSDLFLDLYVKLSVTWGVSTKEDNTRKQDNGGAMK